MAARKKKWATKEEFADIEHKVEALSRRLAEKKERTQWLRLTIEKRFSDARLMRERVRALQISALGMEDRSDRAKTLAEIQTLQKDIDDRLFSLAGLRSDARRVIKEIPELEGMLDGVRKVLDKERAEVV